VKKWLIVLVVLVFAGTAGIVKADVTYISTLPYEITAPGYYILNVSVSDFNPTAYGVNYAIKINASNVVLDGTGHTIDGADDWSSYGIYVYSVTNVTVKNIEVTDWYYGIYYDHVQNGSIINTIANSNQEDGIVLRYSSYNTLVNDTANYNIVSGFRLEYSSYNILLNNNASSNYGLTSGIDLHYSNGNTLSGNTVSSNGGDGITVTHSINNTLTGNIITSNDWGILLWASYKNSIINNTITNDDGGIYLYYGSSNNMIYNNLFNNTVNVYFGGAYSNFWNTTKTPGTNIIGGSYIGGNAWFKPDGTGFSETCADADRDGICDEPFAIDSLNVDYLPLALYGDKVPPQVEIVYPQNTTYSESITSIKANVTDNFQVTRVIAEVDGEYNVTLIFNGTYYVNTTVNIGDGHHWIRIYAYDLAGNVNSTEKVYFTVEVPQRIEESRFLGFTYFYYLRYMKLLNVFNESYTQAIKLGINNETLSKVLALKRQAEAEWRIAWYKGNPVITLDLRAFIQLRRAYLHLKEAEKILEAFLASAGS